MFCSFDVSGNRGLAPSGSVMTTASEPVERSEDGNVGAQLGLWRPPGEQPAGPDPIAASIDAYLDDTEAAEGTRESYRTTKRRWLEWTKKHRSLTPVLLESLTAGDLRDWLAWCFDEARSAGDANPENTFNKRRREMHAVLKWLFEEERIEALPRFPKPKDQRKVAGLYFLTDQADHGELSEMERLYWAAHDMPVPPRWRDPRPIGLLWRTALVLFRDYGMDTQVLFPYKARAANVLRWKHVSPGGLPPGRVANVQCEHGWLTLKRQKTGRLMFLPLEPVVRAHLDEIRPEDVDPEEPILGRAGGMRPCQRFQRLARAAQLQDKVDIETGAVTPWVLKDLRKTCATAHNANRPGSAQYVLGHSGGAITDKHYANALPVLLEAFRTLPQPRAFRSIVDDSIKPPAGLFAR